MFLLKTDEGHAQTFPEKPSQLSEPLRQPQKELVKKIVKLRRSFSPSFPPPSVRIESYITRINFWNKSVKPLPILLFLLFARVISYLSICYPLFVILNCIDSFLFCFTVPSLLIVFLLLLYTFSFIQLFICMMFECLFAVWYQCITAVYCIFVQVFNLIYIVSLHLLFYFQISFFVLLFFQVHSGGLFSYFLSLHLFIFFL